MKVKELIAALQQIDGEQQVIMQKDSEGNAYSPLAGWWEGAYLPITTWYGEAGFETLTEEDKARGYGREDIIVGGQKAVFLTPVN